ncbi:ATP-binding protein [Kitasatospora sp. MMS16-BH015]|uniref:sensor histidine kinase n=1 Tax=Kitasatospora sp. MMS16-BH015 TaxID=2018025 RepID=UPI000CA380DC|nr:nitrate- and nitrite sensing domain-containing protein [Kitasatospora sp. MMS16-BH015]AUG80860.1 ATP-binding protein [Kitasatospora sp. MMS16-BH015]
MRVRRGTSRSAPTAAPSAGRGPVRPGGTGQRRGAHAGPPARESVAELTGEVNQAAGQTGWQRLRPRTVRARIIALLMVPVVSVLALWAFATVTTAQDVWSLIHLQDTDRTVLAPVRATLAGLQEERTAAGQLLAGSGAGRESALREAGTATDRAFAPLALADRYNRADAEGLGPETAARVDALGTAVAALPALRARLLARTVGWDEAYAAYAAATDRAFEVLGSTTQLQDHRAASDARVLLELSRSHEQLAREDALLRAGQAVGSLTTPQLRSFADAVAARRLFEQTAAPDLRPADRTALAVLTTGTDHRDLTRAEDAVAGANDGGAAVAAIGPDQWQTAADAVGRGLTSVEDQAGSAAVQRVRPYALGLFTPAGTAVLLGLIAVLASLLISVQIGRGLVTELIALRNSALELALRKLPSTIRRLRAGEEIDVAAEAPLRGYGEDEIGQVHGALDTVQRAAVTAAVERAEVLSGVSGVFVNLARRSQVLVHRQLTLLDAMERRTEDPAELEDLFRLDHLTTRMRRHAEGLIILSGAVPGRAWRRPVPLMDVVRAAVAEVEEYARVEVHRLPFAAVAGPAVADLTHLVAELVENATGFSPPHTKVHIRGEQVGNGYALEIEDRGLGMGPEALSDANRRIGATDQVDLFDSDRLGLFVVSRLARRHEVKVALRPSAYGGTTAVVLLPTTLLDGSETEPPAAPRSLPAAAPQPAPPVPQLAPPAPEPAPASEPASAPASAADTPDVPEAATPPSPSPAQPPATVNPFGMRDGSPGVLRPTPFGGPRTPARPDLVPQALVPGPTAGASGPAEGELPRRVRQASLAPQLREAPLLGGSGTDQGRRDPDQARAAMSAYQQGWARGKGRRAGQSDSEEGKNR